MASRGSYSVGNGPDEDYLTGILRASCRCLVGVANEDPITRLRCAFIYFFKKPIDVNQLYLSLKIEMDTLLNINVVPFLF